jgi:hypothetical protein
MLYDPTAEIYVIKCQTPGFYYVGSSYRAPGMRAQEQAEGHCVWTSRHGINRYLTKFRVPFEEMHARENEVTMFMCKRHGWRGVRGGDFTWARQDRAGNPIDPPETIFFNMEAKGFGDFSLYD